MTTGRRDTWRALGLALCVAAGCDRAASIAPGATKGTQSDVVAVGTEPRPVREEERVHSPQAVADRCLPDRVAVAIGGGASRSICFDRTEVTIAAYTVCVQAGQCTEPTAYTTDDPYERYHAFCNWRHPEDRSAHPANCLSFKQAQAFCAARGGRLPTDVEWKWVASNGGRTRYPWGDAAPNSTRVNSCGLECPDAVRALTADPSLRPLYKQKDGYIGTAPVGSFPKGDNAEGIHDLAGNVAEFVSPVSSAESTGDLTTGGSCFSHKPEQLAATDFSRTKWAGATSPSLGFRCVVE